MEVWTKCLRQKLPKVTILEVFTLVSQSISHILSNNIACLSKGLKTKILFKEFHILVFSGPNVDPGWVKNGKKRLFSYQTLTPNPVSPKKEVLKSHSFLSH